MYLLRYFLGSISLLFLVSCQSQTTTAVQLANKSNENIRQASVDSIIVGAARIDTLLQIIGNKSVGIVANQTSLVATTHLVDTLLSLGVQIVRVYSPEHGFRGKADAGAHVTSHIDKKTKLPIVSLYGKNRKPTDKQMQGIDLILFDLQDVGTRFYTYISTLHYVMEAAAKNDVSVCVLDRPNPNGHYIDGPIRLPKYQSFVGMDPIPIVHGMTIGELALMMNGEKWLNNDVHCNLSVLKCLHYNRNMTYSLPISPSPNLRSDAAIALYPSLCLFEGTIISVGRGTPNPFEIFGHPALKNNKNYPYQFTPKSSFGAQHPKLEDQLCYGKKLYQLQDAIRFYHLHLEWLINAYHTIDRADFFNARWFDLLAGTDQLRKQIIAGKSAKEIRISWQTNLEKFKKERKPYLLYP